MKYSIKVNEVRAKEGSNIKGFATVVFGDSFKITNIAILENKDKGELFVSMPRYRSNERDESNGVIYKDVCNPITAEFREELYTNILDAYARIREPEKEDTQKQERTQEMPEFSVTVTPYEREGSNIKGLARIYFENSFIVNNINIVQGKGRKQIVFFIVDIAVFVGDRILFASYFSGEVSIFQGRYRCDEVFEKLPQLMLFF